MRKECERQDAVLASLMPGCAKVAGAHARNQARLRCAMAALAIERFRQAQRFWPASLDAVVETGFLKAVPIDPYDGKPLRYRALADGVLVYSVNVDRIDNGGILNRLNPIAVGTDIGFQLWDCDKRGQPAPPPE